MVELLHLHIASSVFYKAASPKQLIPRLLGGQDSLVGRRSLFPLLPSPCLDTHPAISPTRVVMLEALDMFRVHQGHDVPV